MAKYIFFVEGAEIVREGLGPLLEQELRNRKPRIVACGGRDDTIKRFLGELEKPMYRGMIPLVLIDLDGPGATRDAVAAEKKLTAHTAHTFWMVQEMEAWFLSQPAAVTNVFGKPTAAKLPGTGFADVPKPSRALADIVKSACGEPYDKGRHPLRLLRLLNLSDLRRDFPDVGRLMKALSK